MPRAKASARADHGRDPQLHDELRPPASGGARRVAPGAGARRRGDPARGPAHRLAASGDREAGRIQDLPAVAALHGPAGLRVDDVQRACLLSRHREAARHRSSHPRAIHTRDVRRDHAHSESPALARRALAGRRRDDHVPVLLPRARRPDGCVRGGIGRSPARRLLPAGRRLPRSARAHAAVPGVEDPQCQGDCAHEREPPRQRARLHRGFHAPVSRIRRSNTRPC